MLAKDSRAPRLASKHALSLTTIASVLAPIVDPVFLGEQHQADTGDTRCLSREPVRILCRSEHARDGLKNAAFSQ